MGVNADGRVTIGGFECGHLQGSFKRSLVALSVALAVSLIGFSGFWIVGAYGLSFWLGRRVGLRVQRGQGWRGERWLARFVAWDDARPPLIAFVALLLLALLAVWVAAFGLSVEGVDLDSLTVGEALRLLTASYASVWGWGHPWFLAAAAGAVSLGAVSGLVDGMWVGSVQARTGARFRETMLFGRDWAAWRQERWERRRGYLAGGG